ncbi:monofunctional riboflavin biosynthesis protein RIBA 3, chloroplastic-like [Magnolia sinica]|uniref:monofunctional riboflavin biosynthesis protein RIBA 3, chloroplastic-like n=1 Tax=Magnolia sinica TaxID=86752 RepID=UPI00265A14FF|nr:monofunctional riboflavin biosynthesis protein RIBA 3, chloroplastic-like [Magnolia sinica]
MLPCSIELPKLGDAINEQRVALYSSLEKCLVQLANKFVIAVDDENGDEEGDLIMAASLASSQALAFMIRHGSGIVSVGMKQEDLERLSLPLMSTGSENEDPSAVTYTVTVDLKTGASTGVSASDRAKTILALSSPDSKPQDFRRPGHVFPLKYRNGGVLKRAGHTEASADLVSLAGLRPISVLSAILDAEDGSMARLPALRKIAKENSIPIISILDLIRLGSFSSSQDFGGRSLSSRLSSPSLKSVQC